jgi:hypothetical protein
MIEAEEVHRWNEDGFVILPGHMPNTALTLASGELPMLFPTVDELHDRLDEGRNATTRDEFGAIVDFPCHL